MPTRRLLLVDDSVVIRHGLTAALADAPGIEVAGSAASGRVALMKIPLLQPDVVALDVEMPGMDGLETLAAIRQACPRLPVIMLNVPTPDGAAATIDALTCGARDYVMKPPAAVPSEEALTVLAGRLVSKIALCFPEMSHSRTGQIEREDPLATGRVTHRIDVLAIGASTGGPQALMDLIPVFPAGFPVPILIVQHMPPTFTRLLAERLAARSTLRVAEGSLHQPLAAGHAWIAPGDFHLAVARDTDAVRIVTNQHAAENWCRPAADVLFRSVADVYGPHALAVVLTGMGQDGLKGCERIRAAGGQVLVQDEASSVVWGMPGFVARAGMADRVVPLGELGAEILGRVRRHRPHGRVPA